MKTIYAILLSVGTVCTCLGQGTVNWNSFSPGAITVQTNTADSPLFYGSGAGGVSGNVAPASSSQTFYYFELLYNTNFTGAPTPVPDFNTLFGGTWLDTGLTLTNGKTAGWLAPVVPTSAARVPWGHGTTNNIMLVGWSANLGTSWTDVSNELATGSINTILGLSGLPAFFGESETGYINPGSANPGVNTFGLLPTSSGLPILSPGMQLYEPVPEPTTLALAGLGGLSLMLLRKNR